MDSILKEKTGTLTLILSDIHTELAQNKVLDLVEELLNNEITVLVYEMESKKNFEILKSKGIYLKSRCIVENMYDNATKIDDIKYIIIDGLLEVKTRQCYCLGYGDIIAIMIKQLKQLADKLDVNIIVTAPTKTITIEMKTKRELLSFFCKSELAEEYIDEIILLK